MNNTVQYRRLFAMAFLLAVAFAGLGYRLVDLQLLQHAELRKEAEDNTHKTFLRQPRRGDILDRRGNRLASSIFVKTVCADPSLIGSYQLEVARALAPLLEMPEAELAEKLRLRTYSTSNNVVKIDKFEILKKKVALETWEKVQETMKGLSLGVDEKKLKPRERGFYQNLHNRAIYALPYDEQLRVYPNKSLAAHVLGFVQTVERDSVIGKVEDITGADGIERVMNSALTGVRGWRSTEVAKRRELVEFRDQDVEPHDGRNVVLTIDANLQHIVESELIEVMQRHSAVSATAIMVRPKTGEILALANAPTFDPNRTGDTPNDYWRNRAISDVAEPGSTFKIVAISGALNDGLVNLDTVFDCEHGSFAFAGKRLRDDHPMGAATVEEVVARSSNIGTAKIAMQMGPERLARYIHEYGFGRPTGIQLLGEVSGLGSDPKNWTKISISRVPIGQGIAVTPLQTVMAMSAIANGGRLMRPLLVDHVVDDDGAILLQNRPEPVRQVVSEATAKRMVTALRQVVVEGTGKSAALEHYTVAGKTGTAQKPGRGGYAPGKFFSSFVGFFPEEDAELCIGVFVNEPKTSAPYHGAQTGAPAFRNIAERAAKYLALKPDIMPNDPENGKKNSLTVARQN